MKKVAIICCFNQDEILDAMLLHGLKPQTGVEIEEKLIRCDSGQWKSAGQAYNDAAGQTESDYLIFVHQDIKLQEKDTLEKIVQELDESPDCIFGLCGAKGYGEQKKVYSNIYHGILNQNMGEQIAEKMEVETLDECFLAMKKELFLKIKFDEKNLDGWHFYVVDFCLRAGLKGCQSYVLPYSSQHKNVMEMPGYVLSIGIYPKEFYHYARVLRKQHKNNCGYISSPCCTFRTKGISFYLCYYLPAVFKRTVKYVLRHLSF